MTFRDILAEAIEWLQQDKRISYRALRRQFDLDDDALDDLKVELTKAKRLAVDEDEEVLVWKGEVPAPTQNPEPETDRETRFQALIPEVLAFIQRHRRVTYHRLTVIFGLDDKLLGQLCKELMFQQVVRDEQGEGLVWTGESEPTFELANVPMTGPDVALEAQPNSVDSLPSDLAPPTAERRQLTVMFCDLVGSTDLSGKLDPEDLREVVRAYQETAAEVIECYEGHIAQYLGDGLLIYFGFPIAHEDDAQRAIYTGLGIPAAIAELNTKLQSDYDVQLAVRIGIHTGPVVVGEMGSGDRHENLALGETPNIAARLEGLAQANTMVISSVTAQLIQRSFVLEELGYSELKGVSEPMQLYTVVRPREVERDDHEAMLSGGFDALVGRDEEIGLLLRRWEQSKEGQGQVVLISGEAGLGKSSLVEGLRSHVHQDGYTRIAFRCSPYTANSAMHPVIEHIQRVLGWEREDSTGTRLDKLEQAIQSTSLPMEETVPLFVALLSLSIPEDRYPTLTFSPQRQRQLTQDALVTWMLEGAERQPVLAVWEDLHWADPSTLELLGLFIEQVPTVPMLNVLAYRPEFIPPWPTQSHMTPITLNRLERTHIEALVRRLAGGKLLPQEVAEHIVGKTDGVPLYVEELTKMLLESDLIEEESDQYILTGTLSSASIPATLQDSLMARLDRLPEVREVAQLGAVLGREFDYEMLQALKAIDEPTLQSGLSQLVSHELLYQRGRIPHAKFIFRHVLIRDAAYQSLLRRTRQQYHKQVAHILEARFRDVVELQPELVAYHYSEAGCSEEAIGYWQRAGQQASARSAHQEAISHLTTGLGLLHTLPENLERYQQELQLQTELGAASQIVKGYTAPEAEVAYTRARLLCQKLGDTQDVFPVIFGLWRFYNTRSDFPLARQLGEQLLGRAERRDELPLYVMAHYALGSTLMWMGELVPAHRHFEESIVRYTPAQRSAPIFRSGQDPCVTCLVSNALVLWLQGYPDQALVRVQDALALATELDHSFSYAFALNWASVIWQFRREERHMDDHTMAAVRLSTEQGFQFLLVQAACLRGWVLTALGKGEEGLEQLRQSLSDWRAAGAGVFVPYFLTLLAEGYGNAKQVDNGLDALQESLEVSEQTGENWWQSEAYHLKGDLLLQQDLPDVAKAESCFQQALDCSRYQQAKSLELRAATSLARLWQSQGKRDEARELLSEIYAWFTEGFDTADLIDAKTLLAELSEGR